MSTKGASNRYGNYKFSNHNKHGVNYLYAKAFNKNALEKHFDEHAKEFGFKTITEYEQHAIRFANTIFAKSSMIIDVDYKGTTYKFNVKTRELAIIDNEGYIISYYKVNKYYKVETKKGKFKKRGEIWKKK